MIFILSSFSSFGIIVFSGCIIGFLGVGSLSCSEKSATISEGETEEAVCFFSNGKFALKVVFVSKHSGIDFILN